ncbi:hypothetical protein [Prosthecochloris ethylica]|uniref:hypothetical protein n=1 Tax=Prosthecochloris ethylica TaxID=2743976 RepID=UPI0015823D35|nr:hypothetical protein [Prosthecochloris ethylica]
MPPFLVTGHWSLVTAPSGSPASVLLSPFSAPPGAPVSRLPSPVSDLCPTTVRVSAADPYGRQGT